jgi:hypothetical protein
LTSCPYELTKAQNTPRDIYNKKYNSKLAWIRDMYNGNREKGPSAYPPTDSAS